MSTTNHQSIQQIKANTAALRGTREAHQPDAIAQTKGKNNMSKIEFPFTRRDAADALVKLHGFIGGEQLSVIGEISYSEECRYIFSKLVELAEIVTIMPTTYQTDGQGDQAIAQLHYFTPGSDWYITERDCENEQMQAFGMADLGYGAELGYISIIELLKNGAEIDLHWTPRALAEI
jgi:hypothetical protein